MEKHSETVVLTSMRIDKSILQNFRVAVSRKHKGLTRGTTYVELNNALKHWTEIMNDESERAEPRRMPPRAPVFSPAEKGS